MTNWIVNHQWTSLLRGRLWCVDWQYAASDAIINSVTLGYPLICWQFRDDNLDDDNKNVCVKAT